jgi:hypothetical protein
MARSAPLAADWDTSSGPPWRPRRGRTGSPERGLEPPVWPRNARQHTRVSSTLTGRSARSLPQLNRETPRSPSSRPATAELIRRVRGHADDDTRHHHSCRHRSGRHPANLHCRSLSTGNVALKAPPTGRPPGNSTGINLGPDKTNRGLKAQNNTRRIRQRLEGSEVLRPPGL